MRTMEEQEILPAFSIDVACLGPAVALILAGFPMFETLCATTGLCFLVLANEEPELRHWMPVSSLLLPLQGHNPFQGSSRDMGRGNN